MLWGGGRGKERRQAHPLWQVQGALWGQQKNQDKVSGSQAGPQAGWAGTAILFASKHFPKEDAICFLNTRNGYPDIKK